ncbi:MAG TPA: hypothetical protein VGV61_02730 [Thermoanaerobaculia bacterium]|jgi:hypothetical protein|nr:hypothetical protein [Thermoanaerobaculia bacterium]
MVESMVTSPLLRWETFYVIVGSSAAALTGLQFVVIALVAESRLRGSGDAIDAFSTPTIVHFSVVLWISAVLSAPWRGLAPVAWVLGITAAGCAGYALLVVRRARRQTSYKPVLEDWLWHIIFPPLAYAMVLGAALAMVRQPTGALFTVAAAVLFLLFIGIHNAWDTVTYVALQHMEARPENAERREPPPG